MGCCGKRGPVPVVNREPGGKVRPAVVFFRCCGPAAITAWGPISQKRYWFPPSGFPVSVDVRDAEALAKVPNLALVKRVEWP